MIFFAKAQIANQTCRFIRRFMQSQYTSFHQGIYKWNVRTCTPIKRHIEITGLLLFVYLKGSDGHIGEYPISWLESHQFPRKTQISNKVLTFRYFSTSFWCYEWNQVKANTSNCSAENTNIRATPNSTPGWISKQSWTRMKVSLNGCNMSYVQIVPWRE